MGSQHPAIYVYVFVKFPTTLPEHRIDAVGPDQPNRFAKRFCGVAWPTAGYVTMSQTVQRAMENAFSLAYIGYLLSRGVSLLELLDRPLVSRVRVVIGANIESA